MHILLTFTCNIIMLILNTISYFMILSDYGRPSGSSMSNGVTMDGTEGPSSSFLIYFSLFLFLFYMYI